MNALCAFISGLPHQTHLSNSAKIMTMLCTCFGIPLLLIYLAVMGSLMANSLNRLYLKLCCCRAMRLKSAEFMANSQSQEGGFSNRQQRWNGVKKDKRKRTRLAMIVPNWMCWTILICYLLGSALIFSALQGWTFVDSVFFCFTLLATVGLPADSIRDQSSWPSGLFILCCTLYLLIGLGLVAMTLTVGLQSASANRSLRKFLPRSRSNNDGKLVAEDASLAGDFEDGSS